MVRGFNEDGTFMDSGKILFAFSFIQGSLMPEQLIPSERGVRPVSGANYPLSAWDSQIYEDLFVEWERILNYFKLNKLYAVAHRYDKIKDWYYACKLAGLDKQLNNYK